MTLNIPDDILRQSGLTEREALIEFACRLFDIDRLDKTAAARMAGLSRVEFEIELAKRNLPVYHISDEDGLADLDTVKRMGA